MHLLIIELFIYISRLTKFVTRKAKGITEGINGLEEIRPLKLLINCLKKWWLSDWLTL